MVLVTPYYGISCFNFGTAVTKIFNKFKKMSPRKKFLETLSFVLPAKTAVGLSDGSRAAYAAAYAVRPTAPRRAAWKIPTILQCSAAQRERRWYIPLLCIRIRLEITHFLVGYRYLCCLIHSPI